MHIPQVWLNVQKSKPPIGYNPSSTLFYPIDPLQLKQQRIIENIINHQFVTSKPLISMVDFPSPGQFLGEFLGYTLGFLGYDPGFRGISMDF